VTLLILVVSQQIQEINAIRAQIADLEKNHYRTKAESVPPGVQTHLTCRQDAEITKLRREKLELEGKSSPAIVSRVAPPAIGLGSGGLFPQLTPNVRDGKPMPGTTIAPNDYINGGAAAYGDNGQGAKRPRHEDPYSSSRGGRP